MLILWIGAIAVLWEAGSTRWLDILTMGFTELFLGRAAAVAQATQMGMGRTLIVVLATYVDAMTVFIFYPVLVFCYRNFFEQHFFQKHMRKVFTSAEKGLSRFAKYKLAGIMFFVWIPFWGTGVVVGAVLGYLLGLKTWAVMTSVTLGTASAAVCWVFFYDRLFDRLADIHPAIPVALTIVVIVFLAVHRITARRRRERGAPAGGRNAQGPKAQSMDTPAARR
jgi:uncharacterized membrane protein